MSQGIFYLLFAIFRRVRRFALIRRTISGLRVETRDPLSEEGLFLLREAALEARRLYSDLIDPAAPMPANEPLRPGDIYLIAFLDENPVWVAEL
jgi:hypothetical protein